MGLAKKIRWLQILTAVCAFVLASVAFWCRQIREFQKPADFARSVVSGQYLAELYEDSDDPEDEAGSEPQINVWEVFELEPEHPHKYVMKITFRVPASDHESVHLFGLCKSQIPESDFEEWQKRSEGESYYRVCGQTNSVHVRCLVTPNGYDDMMGVDIYLDVFGKGRFFELASFNTQTLGKWENRESDRNDC